MAIELTLVHIGGERKSVVVLGQEGYKLLIRWGIAGTYKLDLKSNLLLRTRGQWSAADIEIARSVWRQLRAPKPQVVYVRRCTVCHGAGTVHGNPCFICKRGSNGKMGSGYG
jgi:hypothetical protein